MLSEEMGGRRYLVLVRHERLNTLNEVESCCTAKVFSNEP